MPISIQENYVDQGPAYPDYLPTWSKETYSPLKPDHNVTDPALRADQALPNLFPVGANVEVNKLTPKIGSEIRGVQLSSLSPAGLDELALFVAQRGVVALRAQDFRDIGIEKQLDIGRHFGKLHQHPTTATAANSSYLHVIYRDAELGRKFLEGRSDRITSIGWHSDVTYEVNPPSYTFLVGLAVPPTGGDTLFSSATEAYKRLSPDFAERLHGLRVVHSSFEQDAESRSRDGPSRRPPVRSEHPLIRKNVVTGEPMLWINSGFSRSIVGFKAEESDYLLRFLNDHIAKGQDFQCRVKWEEGDVVVWDNRAVTHSAVYDYDEGHRRHMVRITPTGEIPVAF